MGRFVHNQTNFTAGELSPRMKGRGDVARYQNGAETIENGLVVVHGGVMRRPGLRYLAEAKHGGARVVRLIRYVFSVEQSYMLEFGHLYVRVFDGTTGAVLLNDALAVLEITTPYTESQLAEITTKQTGDVLFLFHGDVQPQQLRRLTPTRWILIPVPWSVLPFSENGHSPDAGLTLSAATVGAGRTFTTAAVVAPGAPTIGVAVPLNASARVNFTPPASTGGGVITSYTATSSPGGLTKVGTSSPLVVSGLTNGVAYTFTVTATNAAGTGPASAASNSVTPLASLTGQPLNMAVDTSNFSATVPNGVQRGILGPTATASNGTAPYTYAWSKVSGSSALIVSSGTSANVSMRSENYGATNYATLKCVATDALGASGEILVSVSVTHAASSGPLL